jgi:hypothetical protein
MGYRVYSFFDYPRIFERRLPFYYKTLSNSHLNQVKKKAFECGFGIEVEVYGQFKEYPREIGLFLVALAETVDGIIDTDIGNGYAQSYIGEDIPIGYYTVNEFKKAINNKPKKLSCGISALISDVFGENEIIQKEAKKLATRITNQSWGIHSDLINVCLLRLSEGNIKQLNNYFPVKNVQEIIKLGKGKQFKKLGFWNFDDFHPYEEEEFLIEYPTLYKYFKGIEF